MRNNCPLALFPPKVTCPPNFFRQIAAAALKKLKYQMKMYVSLPLVQKLVMRNCMPTWLEMIKIIETGIFLLIEQLAA